MTEAAPLLPRAHAPDDACKPAAAPTDDFHRETSRLGYRYMLVSSFGFSACTFFLRIAETRFRVEPATALLLRGLLHTVLAAAAVAGLRLGARLRMPRATALWLLAGSAFTALGVFLIYQACALIPVGDAVAIFFTMPAFAMLTTFVLIGERVTFIDVGGALVSLVGAYLVGLPIASDSLAAARAAVAPRERLLGSAAAMGAALSFAVCSAVMRKLGTAVHEWVAMLPMSLLSCALALPFGAATDLPRVVGVSRMGTFFMTLSAVGAFVGQATFNKGLQLSRAGPANAIRNMDVPLVYVLSIVFLGEMPTLLRAFGALLIVVSAIFIALQKEE